MKKQTEHFYCRNKKPTCLCCYSKLHEAAKKEKKECYDPILIDVNKTVIARKETDHIVLCIESKNIAICQAQAIVLMEKLKVLLKDW